MTNIGVRGIIVAALLPTISATIALGRAWPDIQRAIAATQTPRDVSGLSLLCALCAIVVCLTCVSAVVAPLDRWWHPVLLTVPAIWAPWQAHQIVAPFMTEPFARAWWTWGTVAGLSLTLVAAVLLELRRGSMGRARPELVP